MLLFSGKYGNHREKYQTDPDLCCLFPQIKDEIEKFKEQGIELEEQRQVILKQLEEKQNAAQKEADEYEQKHKEVAKILDQLKAG